MYPSLPMLRHFARNPARAAKDKKSVNLRGKIAGWATGSPDAFRNKRIS